MAHFFWQDVMLLQNSVAAGVIIFLLTFQGLVEQFPIYFEQIVRLNLNHLSSYLLIFIPAVWPLAFLGHTKFSYLLASVSYSYIPVFFSLTLYPFSYFLDLKSFRHVSMLS